MPSQPTTLELLAPARDADAAIAAIMHGADAVYIGAPALGARAAASNSTDEIKRVVEAAHPFGARVYVTLNTIIYEHELEEARRLVGELWDIGVDALIVQDMGLLGMDIPPIDLHASTQADARTAEKIRVLADAGFSQIVVPREFSLEDIRKAALAAPDSKIEVFVHGALCVSYSGDCQAGALLTGRSANRGECPQICRLEFTLSDSQGHEIANLPDGGSARRHWLSTADMNRLHSLTDLIDAGATSFKIEGRLKNVSYVKNIVAAYSQALDKIIENSGGKYRRASYGKTSTTFHPDASRSFNRGFTNYFLTAKDEKGVTSWQTPKWIGRSVGSVEDFDGRRIKVKALETLNNGDGLGYFDASGHFSGFRINRVEGSFLYPAPDATIRPRRGATLYRNSDISWEKNMMRTDTAERRISVEMILRPLADGRIALDVSDERGCAVTVASELTFTDTARTPQEETRRKTLERIGDTVYRADIVDDRLDRLFIPAKALADLRRKALETLERNWTIRRKRPLRRASTLKADAFSALTTTYHDNVANSAAEKFYQSHGATIGQWAAEVDSPRGEARIMNCRYCLRRELECCLKTDRADLLPRHLFLDAPVGRLRLEFDCKRCNMNVYIKAKSNTKKQ